MLAAHGLAASLDRGKLVVTLRPQIERRDGVRALFQIRIRPRMFHKTFGGTWMFGTILLFTQKKLSCKNSYHWYLGILA